MKLKRDTKFEEELTFHFKIGTMNLTNFDLRPRKSHEGYKIWRGIDLSFQNWHKEFNKI